MELVGRSSPEVTDLLRLDVTGGERRTLKRRSGDLQNRQRRSVCGQRLSDTRNAGNQRRKRKTLRNGDQVRNGGNGVLHFEKSQLNQRIREREAPFAFSDEQI